MQHKVIIAILAFGFLLSVRTSSAQMTLPAEADSLRQVTLSHLEGRGKTMIALMFGQSNAANFGQKVYTPRNALVFNYYNGKLYTARDPLIGTTGKGGSVWTRLGDSLIDSSLYDKVILIPIAIGGSAIERWASGGDLSEKVLLPTLKALDSQNIRLTHIFWHQGETDNLLNTSAADYKQRLGSMLQTLRKYQSAGFYVSIASYHPVAVVKPLGVDNVLRNAQKEFINENNGVLAGPDTDSIIHAIHRHDSVHFSDFGMEAYAQLWFNAIANKKEKSF